MKTFLLIISVSLGCCLPAHAFEQTQMPVRDSDDCRGDWRVTYAVRIPGMGDWKAKALYATLGVKPSREQNCTKNMTDAQCTKYIDCGKLGICVQPWCVSAPDAASASIAGDQFAYAVEHPREPSQQEVDVLTSGIVSQKLADQEYTRNRVISVHNDAAFLKESASK